MKKVYFYIDDTIWVLRELTRTCPTSIFDVPLFAALKKGHDKYGLKVQMNLFYRTDSFYGYDEFSLADVTDSYKKEFEEASDWLKFAFHALEEFPDYPHVNATYDDTKWLFKAIEKEVIRYAGEKSFTYAVCPHWLPVSKEGVRALYDCGVKILDATVGDVVEYNEDPFSLPYGHSARLLNNRQPETKVFTRGGRDVAISHSICGYNHLSKDDSKEIRTNLGLFHNDEIGIKFKTYCSTCLNTTPYEELEEEFAPLLNQEYIGVCDHEQYFYADYFNYQPDYADKIYKMCEMVTKNDYEFFFMEELIK
ncbi:MAG: hypothetical protein E7393_06430 [Ruminococcaceae bacterium]|nr:hypothetical protein [Oscillospiraceae bacterium]